jgi:NAD(P)-dependent dehydrogenase (short-subunit alcohol dehydrogenase family)
MLTPPSGRSVLVTGGTKGIGKGIAAAIVTQGTNLALSLMIATSG